MDRMTQFAAVLVIAFAAGLCMLNQQFDSPASLATRKRDCLPVKKGVHRFAAVSGGVRTGFVDFVALALVVSWASTWMRVRSSVASATQ
jgi:hypothetical protein